ncbi:MAG: DUF368 domain-containing protein [Oscillospiraceae bacterium]|jgi:putative membrane protein
MILTIFHGFCMALADSVPGISGGTVAFIMGFYEQFITSIHNLFGTDTIARKAGIRYLFKLGIGWCVGLSASVLVLSSVFEKNIHFLSSLFLGLTIASIPFVIHSEKAVFRNHLSYLIFTVVGLAVVYGLTAYRVTSPGGAAVHFLTLTPLQLIYLAIAGVFAISAMVLPGISGSTFLLILGVYMPIVNAVKQLLHFHLDYLPGFLAFGAGVLFGVFLSARCIRACLRKYHAQMLYLILGFMLGSIYAVVMGPLTLDVPQSPLGVQNFDVLGFFVGILILFALELLKHGLPVRKKGRGSENTKQKNCSK